MSAVKMVSCAMSSSIMTVQIAQEFVGITSKTSGAMSIKPLHILILAKAWVVRMPLYLEEKCGLDQYTQSVLICQPIYVDENLT